MGNPILYSIDDLKLTRFLDDHYITFKFWQRSTAKRYYRLRCIVSSATPSEFSTIYIYLGSVTTSSKSDYTVLRRIEKITNASSQVITFEELFTQFPDSSTLRPSCYLQSSPREDFSSGVEESNESRLFSIKLVGDNFGPTWSAPTWIDELYSTNEGVALLTGSSNKGLQGVSRIRFDFPEATARYGTTIDHYSIVVTGGFSHTLTPGHIHTVGYDYLPLKTYYKLVGEVTVTFSVEDSRGMTTSITRTITIIPYKPLYLSVNNTHRQGGTGSTVLLDFSGRWHGSPLTLTCKGIKAYEEGSSTVYASLDPTIMVSGTSFSFSGVWDRVTFDPDKAYKVIATFTDIVKTVTLTFPIPVGTPVLSIRDKRVGIQNSSPSYTLDVSGIIGQNGHPIVGYVREIVDETASNSVDLNNYTDAGYYVYSSLANDANHFPNATDANRACVVEVLGFGSYIIQKLFYLNNAETHIRTFSSSGWSSWKKVTTT